MICIVELAKNQRLSPKFKVLARFFASEHGSSAVVRADHLCGNGKDIFTYPYHIGFRVIPGSASPKSGAREINVAICDDEETV